MLILIKEEFAVKFLNDPEAAWGINYPKRQGTTPAPQGQPHPLLDRIHPLKFFSKTLRRWQLGYA